MEEATVTSWKERGFLDLNPDFSIPEARPWKSYLKLFESVIHL